MSSEHTSVETIRKHVGAWNTDIASGWETGLLGKRRVGGRLFERYPPDHLYKPENAKRLDDWRRGMAAAKTYRERVIPQRETHFVGKNKEGDVVVVRKGWVARGPVVTQLQNRGCGGDVMVFYFEGSKIKRTVQCGI